MGTLTQSKPDRIPLQPEVRPLENGDHLTREEFERRYEAMPDLKKAELIEGVVFMPSPVRHRAHASPQAALITWLGHYWSATPGVEVGDNGTVRLDLDTDPQPDAVMFIDASRGGQARLSEDDFVEGAPELVAEVAASSASLDMNAKFRVYRRNSAREYIIWRVLDKAIDWFVLREANYDRLPLGPEGIYQSEVFPGLWLDPQALVAFDLAAVLRVLQQGLVSPEHQAFVQKLQQKTNSAQ